MKIFKYSVPHKTGDFALWVPGGNGTTPLKFACQNQQLTVWLAVDDKAPVAEATFTLLFTGHDEFSAKQLHSYIDTVEDAEGLVWHLFKR